MMPRSNVVLVGVIAVLLSSCSSESDPPAPSAAPTASATPSPTSTATLPPGPMVPGDPRIAATDLDAPWSIVFLNGTALVSERDSGRILELDSNGTARVVGTVAGVVHQGESGLLGLAVDARNRLFAYSTGSDGNRIQRFAVTGRAGAYALGTGKTILDRLPSASFHDGGRLAFGPDGMLYATVGDAGVPGAAQDRDSLAGKILRMTADGGVPADNPFPRSLVWSFGHRNPQGLTWADDGTMFATEFGQNTWDELNVITRGGNYGWPTVEGIEGRKGFIDPVQQWNPDSASPSGLVHTNGTLFLANLRGRVLRSVQVATPGKSTTYFEGQYGRIRDVALAPDGRLWLLTNNTDGRGDPRRDDDRIISLDLRTR